MRVSCGETTGNTACEMSTTLSKTMSLYHWYASSRDFEKFPFNCSCKLIVNRNTTKNELLTKFLK